MLKILKLLSCAVVGILLAGSVYAASLASHIAEARAAADSGIPNPDLFSFNGVRYSVSQGFPADAKPYAVSFTSDDESVKLKVVKGKRHYFKSEETYGEGAERKPIYKLKISHKDVSRFKNCSVAWYRKTEGKCCELLKGRCPYAFLPPLVVAEEGEYIKVFEGSNFYGWRRQNIVIICMISHSLTEALNSEAAINRAAKSSRGVSISIDLTVGGGQSVGYSVGAGYGSYGITFGKAALTLDERLSSVEGGCLGNFDLTEIDSATIVGEAQSAVSACVVGGIAGSVLGGAAGAGGGCIAGVVGWAKELGMKEFVIAPLWDAITEKLIPSLVQLGKEFERAGQECSESVGCRLAVGRA